MIKIKYGHSLWWSNTKNRHRQDTLIGITRTYCRNEKLYIYRLTIGKLTIGWIKS